jgi:hypothetical protein
MDPRYVSMDDIPFYSNVIVERHTVLGRGKGPSALLLTCQQVNLYLLTL